MNCCPLAAHDALKATPEALRAGAVYLGVQYVPDGPPLHLWNCLACRGTLAVEDQPTPGGVTWKP